MTIYILSINNKETAKYLDDEALKKMILDIDFVISMYDKDLDPKNSVLDRDLYDWYQWTKLDEANYECLVSIGDKCVNEWAHRFVFSLTGAAYITHSSRNIINSKKHKLKHCHDYVMAKIPLIVPREYHFNDYYNPFGMLNKEKIKILSYRQYYIKKVMGMVKKCPCGEIKKALECLSIHPEWTNRKIPDFVSEKNPLRTWV